ncbi:MAG: CYTH domain-containing protein [Luteolibacter sp.]
MPAEIERKFLVADDSWRDGMPGVRIAQGYLSQDPERTVRVRLAGKKAWITIKGRTQGITRAEFEYAIPPEEARELLAMCPPSVIDKTRHEIRHGGHVWEVDVFHGENDGLVVAEVELSDENETPEMPAWLGTEVSDDARYFNSHLARHPFMRWAAISEE